MATTDIDLRTAELALAVLDELIDYQRKRVKEYANRLHPGLTDEDIRNIHDFPKVYADPQFQFEDGQLAGFVAARIAIKARLVGGTLRPG
jgi:hypothetical protein